MKKVDVYINEMKWDSEVVGETNGLLQFARTGLAEADCMIQITEFGQLKARFNSKVVIPFKQSVDLADAQEYIKSLFC